MSRFTCADLSVHSNIKPSVGTCMIRNLLLLYSCVFALILTRKRLKCRLPAVIWWKLYQIVDLLYIPLGLKVLPTLLTQWVDMNKPKHSKSLVSTLTSAVLPEMQFAGANITEVLTANISWVMTWLYCTISTHAPNTWCTPLHRPKMIIKREPLTQWLCFIIGINITNSDLPMGRSLSAENH